MFVALGCMEDSFNACIFIIFDTTTERIFYFHIRESDSISLVHYKFSIIEVSLISTIDLIAIRSSHTHRDTSFLVRITLPWVSSIRPDFFFALGYCYIIGNELITTSVAIARSRVPITIPTSINLELNGRSTVGNLILEFKLTLCIFKNLTIIPLITKKEHFFSCNSIFSNISIRITWGSLF